MIKRKLLLVSALMLSTLLSTSYSSDKEASATELLVKNLAIAIIKNDKNLFAKTLISNDELIVIGRQLIKAAKDNIQYVKFISRVEENLADLKKNAGRFSEKLKQSRRSFKILQLQSKRDGINLQKATFGKVVNTKVKEFLGQKNYRIQFTLIVNSSEYMIGIEAMSAPSRIALFNDVRWEGKKK